MQPSELTLAFQRCIKLKSETWQQKGPPYLKNLHQRRTHEKLTKSRGVMKEYMSATKKTTNTHNSIAYTVLYLVPYLFFFFSILILILWARFHNHLVLLLTLSLLTLYTQLHPGQTSFWSRAMPSGCGFPPSPAWELRALLQPQRSPPLSIPSGTLSSSRPETIHLPSFLGGTLCP